MKTSCECCPLKCTRHPQVCPRPIWCFCCNDVPNKQSPFFCVRPSIGCLSGISKGWIAYQGTHSCALFFN
nr:hypothetical protein CFP56_27044 [Quercus suber]